MTPDRRRLSPAGALLGSAFLGLLATACQSPGARARAAEPPPEAAPPARGDRPFYEGTDRQRELVAEQIGRFSSPKATDRLEAARRLGTLGEPAVGALVVALREHPEPRTRSMSAYTLGFLADRRAVEPLAAALKDGDVDVRMESAAALTRLGDDRGAALLIRGLEDADPRVRLHAIGVLADAVGDRFGYEVDGDPLERAAAVARWRGWLERRREQGL